MTKHDDYHNKEVEGYIRWYMRTYPKITDNLACELLDEWVHYPDDIYDSLFIMYGRAQMSGRLQTSKDARMYLSKDFPTVQKIGTLLDMIQDRVDDLEEKGAVASPQIATGRRPE